ncbi:MAG TPA: cobalamin-dependent protein [Chitinivibrionales bacterium]|nr:cobalamin-dependent protein [Chitinivibrionales bacterium]
MKLRLLYPKFKKFLEDHASLREELKGHVIGDYTMPPSLALPIIAALTPRPVGINLTDDNITPVDFDEKVDLAVISCFTPQAQRAYEIADEFKKRGTKTIIGGVHPTALPDEALAHADAVCVGEGEQVWHAILSDLQTGSLKKKYSAQSYCDLAKMPVPRRAIFSPDNYRWKAHLVQVMRGCPAPCAGCPVPYMGGTLFRLRPVENIIADIKSMPYKELYFTDDTVMLPGKKPMKFLLKIMERTAEMADIKIFLASTMMMTPDLEFYRKLKNGGTASIYTVFGFDKNSQLLFDKSCTADHWSAAVDLVRMIEDIGIHFFGSFGIGFDNQDKGVTERILKFTQDARIDLAEFYIPTPFPGTKFGERIAAENRLLHRNYSLWNHANVVFKPKNFTETELLDAFHFAWREFYKDKKPENTVRSFTLNEKKS